MMRKAERGLVFHFLMTDPLLGRRFVIEDKVIWDRNDESVPENNLIDNLSHSSS